MNDFERLRKLIDTNFRLLALGQADQESRFHQMAGQLDEASRASAEASRASAEASRASAEASRIARESAKSSAQNRQILNEALKALEIVGSGNADIRKELDSIKQRLEVLENKKAG